jgi:hypothetical protein
MNFSFLLEAEGLALCFVASYAVRGLFRSPVKSFFSFLLLPVALIAYLWVPIFVCESGLFPKNLLMLIGIVAVSFIGVSLGKWLLFLFLTFFFRGAPSSGFQFWPRFLGILCTLLEGIFIVMVAFWILDFFDFLSGKKSEKLYEFFTNSQVYSRVTEKNPLYRISAVRKIKYVLKAHTIPESLEKIVSTPVFIKLMETEVIRKIRDDQALQIMIEKKQWFPLLKNQNMYDFMKSKEIFSILTSNDFTETCRLALPKDL